MVRNSNDSRDKEKLAEKITEKKFSPTLPEYNYTHYTNTPNESYNRNLLSHLFSDNQSTSFEDYRKNINYLITGQVKKSLNISNAIKEIRQENSGIRRSRVVSRNELIARPRTEIEGTTSSYVTTQENRQKAKSPISHSESTNRSQCSRCSSVLGSMTESHRRIIERAEKDRIARHTPKKVSKAPTNAKKMTKRLERFINSVF